MQEQQAAIIKNITSHCFYVIKRGFMFLSVSRGLPLIRLREAEVVGSNPATPTRESSKNGHLAHRSGGRFSLHHF